MKSDDCESDRDEALDRRIRRLYFFGVVCWTLAVSLWLLGQILSRDWFS